MQLLKGQYFCADVLVYFSKLKKLVYLEIKQYTLQNVLNRGFWLTLSFPLALNFISKAFSTGSL